MSAKTKIGWHGPMGVLSALKTEDLASNPSRIYVAESKLRFQFELVLDSGQK
jgi:hypothetical protein